MTTDRELLEAAAKAAGIEVWRGTGQQAGMLFRSVASPDGKATGVEWNPRQDVGDAASLLLRLKLSVDYVGDQPCISGVLQSGMSAEESFCRAIVRAAAAMAQTERTA